MKNELKNKLISVIILTYNSSRTIKKCLDSLGNQTDKNLKVLIVDDDSKDNTLQLIRKFAKKSWIKFKFSRNGAHNISIGRNIGIQNAKTRYVAFLDSDAYADKFWVERILNEFANDKNLALIGGREIPIHRNNFSVGVAINDNAINRVANNFWAIKGCNFALNKELLEGFYFNEKFIHNEESEFIFRIEKKFNWKYNPEIKVEHESRNTPIKFLKQIYKYGKWRVFFSFYSKKFRLIDFIPSFIVLLSIFLSLINWSLSLMIVCFSLLETIFVYVYIKPKIKMIPSIFLAWLIKNIAWGIGVIVGLIKYPFKQKDLIYLK